MSNKPVSWTAPTAFTPIQATIKLPGSKSMTARALVLSALSVGPSTLQWPSRAHDTELMAAGLRALGARVSTMDDDRWQVHPRPLRGPAHIACGPAGTVMRFLPPLAALANGTVTFDGTPAARRRPLRPLIQALLDLGAEIEAPSGGLPMTMHGAGKLRGGPVEIEASASSQFISGLLLAAPDFDEGIAVRQVGPRLVNGQQIRMTVKMLRSAGAAVDDSVAQLWRVAPGRLTGRAWQIEPDLAGVAAFLAAALVTGGEVTVQGWPRSGTQPVRMVRDLFARFGGRLHLGDAGLTITGTEPIHGVDVSMDDMTELTPVVIALAMLADGPSHLRGLGHLRGHESNWLAALMVQLAHLGANIKETGDGVVVTPKPLSGNTFQTHDDHRIAHAGAVLGLRVPGVTIDDISCTAKTLPSFADTWHTMVTGG